MSAAEPLQLAIVYPGDAAVRQAATPDNNRFAALFAAFAEQGVVAHPDVIQKLGTKDVLFDTRHLGWGSDCQRVDSLQQLCAELPARLAGGAARVLKQHRGHSGIGVWKVELDSSAAPVPAGFHTLLRVRHAQRGCSEERLTLGAFAERCAPYFVGSGHMIDQVWQPRLAEGMVRCYLVEDRVAGFGVQAVNALIPAAPGAASHEAPQPGPRLYHGPALAGWQGLKQQLQSVWLPQAQAVPGLHQADWPLLWDCDFMLGPPVLDAKGAAKAARVDSHVLCEINVSSVAPFPDDCVAPLVQATLRRLHQARQQRGR